MTFGGLASRPAEILRGDIVGEALGASVIDVAGGATDAVGTERCRVDAPLAEADIVRLGVGGVGRTALPRLASVNGGIEAVITAGLEKMCLGPRQGSVLACEDALDMDSGRVGRIGVTIGRSGLASLPAQPSGLEQRLRGHSGLPNHVR